MSVKLAGLLVTSGAAPATLVEDALRRQVLSGCALDTALIEAGTALTEAQLLRMLQLASGLPGADAAMLAAADPCLSSLLPAKLAERHCLLPLRAEGRTLIVAVSYPPHTSMIGSLLGQQLQPVVALEVRLREAIARVFGCPLSARQHAVLQLLGPTPWPKPSARSTPGMASVPDTNRASERHAGEPRPWEAAESKLSGKAGTTAGPPPPAGPAAAPPATPGADAPLATESGKAPPPRRLREIARVHEPDGLLGAIGRALETGQSDPPLPRPLPPNRIDAGGLAKRFVAASKRAPALEAVSHDSWTLAEASAALEQAPDRHRMIRVALRFALKSFDFVAAFAVVGGNAVGWAAQSREGPADERVETISLPLDAPSVLRTVWLGKGRYLGPLPTDALSQSLAKDLDRPQPSTVFLCPIEVRNRPVVLLYGDVVGRKLSDSRVGEFMVFVQSMGRHIERLIVGQKRRRAGERSAREAAPGARCGAIPGGVSDPTNRGERSASEPPLEAPAPAGSSSRPGAGSNHGATPAPTAPSTALAPSSRSTGEGLAVSASTAEKQGEE